MVINQGSNAYNEYFRIDVTGWKSEKIESCHSVNIYGWDFDYAIEYENNSATWTSELLKLSFIRADVRLVIGYRDNNLREDEIIIINEQLQRFKYPVTSDEGFYVIMMNMVPTEDEDPFGIRVYSIKEIQASEITRCHYLLVEIPESES